MGRIFNIRNFNRYIGRYSRNSRAKTPEKKLWNVQGIFYEHIPTLALRNLNEDTKNWPMVWKKGKILNLAILVTFDTLKAWQAFRPFPAPKIIKKLNNRLPSIILNFQNNMMDLGVRSIWHVRNLSKEGRMYAVKIMADAVGKVSEYKNSEKPMLGSKVLNFLYPEFFPVWDTMWVKKEALDKEDYHLALKEKERLTLYNEAAGEYASYINFMIKELRQSTTDEYSVLEKAFVNHCEIDFDVLNAFFGDLSPILFELCLLAKHN